MAKFPQSGEVFIPIIDGFTPITAADLQVYQGAIAAVEGALGGGSVNIADNIIGPSASNADLASRLDAFLDADGGLRDVVFMTGSNPLGYFSETGSGGFFGFPKTISRAGEGVDSYFVHFAFKGAGSVDEGGTDRWTTKVPAIWAINGRSPTGLFIVAREMDGTPIDPAADDTVEWAMLVVGYGAFLEN